MSIYEQINWLTNGEEASESVFNRPLKKLVQLLDDGYIEINVSQLLKFNKSLGDSDNPTDNIEITVNRGSETDAIIRWNEDTDKWEFSNGDNNFIELGKQPDIKNTDFDTTDGQTEFNINYTIGQIEVFYEGIKLRDNKYTADNGTSITLNDECNEGDWINIKTW